MRARVTDTGLVGRLELARRQRALAAPGSQEDEDARQEAVFLDWQLHGHRPGASWLSDGAVPTRLDLLHEDFAGPVSSGMSLARSERSDTGR